jgi:hypothetical protein
MQGKYTQWRRYAATKASRALLRAAIRPLVRWQPLEDPEPGYTILLGCVSELAEMVPGNLACLARQRLDNLHEIIIAFDRPRDRLPIDIEPIIRRRFPELPCRFIYYNRAQYAVSRAVNWGWLNAWMNWCLGMAASRTRCVMLHDFDALLLDAEFIEQRYERFCEADCEFLGVRYYEGNGVTTDDKLAVTFELMADAAFIRRRFRPVDLFNHVTMHRGRSVDFDTLLYAQSLDGRIALMDAAKQSMAHPSQLICHFVAHTGGRGHFPLEWNSLLLIPYYICLGGDNRALREMTQMLSDCRDGRVVFHGRPLNVGGLSPAHVSWLDELASRVERAIHGGVRPEIRAYFDALRKAHAACRGAEEDGRSDVAAAA